MKHTFFIVFIVFSSTLGIAQSKLPAIRISYFGSFLINPGMKLGTELPLKSWESGQEGATISKSFLPIKIHKRTRFINLPIELT